MHQDGIKAKAVQYGQEFLFLRPSKSGKHEVNAAVCDLPVAAMGIFVKWRLDPIPNREFCLAVASCLHSVNPQVFKDWLRILKALSCADTPLITPL